MIKVAITDDHPLLLEGLKNILGNSDTIDVVDWFKKFFASLGLAPGVGIEYVDGDISALYQIEMTLAVGYNSDTFFAGINSNAKYFTSNTGSDVQWGDNIARGEIYFGYRFKPPKKLTEITNKINEKLPFKKE